MLRKLKELDGYSIVGRDGEDVGHAADFLFDDQQWRVRYLVVDTGGWLPGRQFILPPGVLGTPKWLERTFPVNLTKDEIEASPPIQADEPVSRQAQRELMQHMSLQPYWAGQGLYGQPMEPAHKEQQSGVAPADEDAEVVDETFEQGGDPHLRSAKEVIGYHIQARDDEIGHIEDFIVEDDTWTVRYAVVDTRNWLPGKTVLVSISWMDAIDWAVGKVRVDLTRESIEKSPSFDPSEPIHRGYEKVLYDYYGRPHYWKVTKE